MLLLIDCNQRRSRVDADLSSVLYNAVAHAHQCPACGKRFLAEGVEHPLGRKITRCAPIGKYGNCSTLHLGQTQTAVGNQEQLGMFIGNDRMATVLANILKYLQVGQRVVKPGAAQTPQQHKPTESLGKAFHYCVHSIGDILLHRQGQDLAAFRRQGLR